MALKINTNLLSLLVQHNLTSATTSLDRAIERMTTGYRINHASDNAANFSISTDWNTLLGSIDIASQNAAMGRDMLNTAEENYDLLIGHFQRIRDLTEQAANGTYGSSSLAALKEEISARLAEIDRIAANTNFNGINLMAERTNPIKIQVGTNDSDYSKISLSSNIFNKATASFLLGVTSNDAFATSATTTSTAASMLKNIDAALKTISSRTTSIGAAQNRIESAISALEVQSTNLTSSLSTIKDSDVAVESSNYIKAQILQQASATLLATANQSPSIALSLV